MKEFITKMKGKKVLSLLLAMVMVLSVYSPAFSPMMGIIAKAAEGQFDVELAFDNLFVFDHWVTNGNSMIIDNDYGSTNAGTITEIDFENGSFKFTNNTNHNIYTRAAAGTGDKTEENFDYYRMPVKAGASYTFSCNFTGTSPAFYPHVFFYTESNEFTGTLINGTFTGEGDYSFNFTVPEGASYIQLRLAIAGNETKDAYAVIKDICVSRYNFEMESTNLFDFDSWAGSSKSNSLAEDFGYDDGTVTADPNTDTITMETNTGSSTSGNLFTSFSFSSNSGYYSIDVEPNTTYTLSYNIADGSNALHFCPYIVRNKDDGSYIDYIGEKALAYGVSNYTFTTTAETEYISVVFSIEHQNQNWTLILKDIGVYETTITDYTVDPVRETYTYNSSTNATYGTLPTPPAETYPEGYIFAGWYTEKDGKGTRIAADTEIIPQSMTVYPKFEPEVDTLTVKTPPTKTTYTVGEKINTAGLVITATQTYTAEITDEEGNVTGTEERTNTFDINSGFYIDPEYAQDTAGTQNITVHYGGKTATFPITVSAGEDKNIVVNGNTHTATVANNNYIINYQATAPFNRYEMTYSSDSYVKGEIVMDGVTEEFFLEPSGNGSFSSYIDSFLRGVSHYNVDSIKFTCLDNEFGNFELLSVTTIAATVPSNSTQYYENAETGYKVGIDLSFGGVVSEIYDLNDDIEARVYTIDGKPVTKVDYPARLDADYAGLEYTSVKTGEINLINKFDRGRYLQQSYYGTSQKPYELGDYNGEEWPYNPVQGGNLVINNADGTTKGNEASKVIDFRITDKQIYIKTRPLDWGKNSVDYPDSYVTDSYMEAWYVFEDGMIKTYCRFVDFSGYPSHTRDQELPAVYIIEPLNTFVYNNVADGSEWETTNYKTEEEPEFWGVLPSYNAVLKANGMSEVDPTVDCYENWAAFAGSANAESFGVGVYSAGVTDFHYGCFFPKYNEDEAKNGQLVETVNRHAVTTDPATENPTSYISPVGNMTFESYKPIEYSYYITTGKADEIYNDFKTIANKDAQAELDKPKIAVPETVYMTPSADKSTIGQYYVNNILDEADNYNIKTEADSDNAAMYLGLHVKDAATFSVKITNATDSSNDIYLCNTSGSEISESTRLSFDPTYTFEDSVSYGLRFSGEGLSPGEKATAKWEITTYDSSGNTLKTYTAYTVMYAPGRTVGAVAEARQVNASQNEISSWITGANGVDHSQRANLGSLYGDFKGAGYFTQDPLVYENAPSGGSGGDATDYIEEVITGADVDNNVYNVNTYVMQTATNDHDSSRAHSYLGLLTVDGSRYTNTDQIPNLKIGYDVLRIGSYTKNSLGKYTTYYTLGNESAYTATSLSDAPSGWTVYSGTYTDFADSHTLPYRESFVPSFDVSTIDGEYIHALNQGVADQTINANQYSTAGTSVLCSVTDKSGLRDAVLEGYTLTATTPEFDVALKNAGTVLGDPSATTTEINTATKELENAMEALVDTFYALKYDNLFSAYEFSQKPDSMKVYAKSSTGAAVYSNGSIAVSNEYISDVNPEAYTNYGSSAGFYNVDLKPDTEYVFEYDVDANTNSQAFMFFFDENGNGSNAGNYDGYRPTNITVKTDNGGWSSRTENNSWWGNYGGSGTHHYIIKFTTGSQIAKAGFRLGNTGADATTSTFSNIRLVDSAHYYEDATYSKTEELFKEYASYGAMTIPVRPGYALTGWKDASGNSVTGADIATAHKTVYSQWNEIKYTINFNKNSTDPVIQFKADAANVTYNQAYTLMDETNATRTYYALKGWAYSADATTPDFEPGATVKIADIADKLDSNNQVTLYAIWEKGYSLYYAGTDITASYKAYSEPHTITDSIPTQYGYRFLGWSLDQNATTPTYKAGDTLTVSEINQSYLQEDASDSNKTYVALYPVWEEIGPQNVTFDNLVDISAWSDTVNNGEFIEETDTGFTIKSNEGVGEATCSSAYFPVVAGNTYKVQADIKGSGWDVYIFFHNETSTGTGLEFKDGSNRFASDGGVVKTREGLTYSAVFTAPAGATKAQLRVDANGSNNVVKFDNIRVQDITQYTTYVNPVNKIVAFGEAYGTLPTPVRDGAIFTGWEDKNGNKVTATDLMESDSTVYLTSTWSTDTNHVLNDTVVVDYGLPVKIELLSNDGDNAESVNAIGTGVSTESLNTTGHTSSKLTGTGTTIQLTYGTATLDGNIVTYTPNTTNFTAEEEFYYEVKIGDSYYYAKVTIIPATSIYYEDTLFTFNNSENDDGTKYEWQTLGKSVGEVFQNADRPGYNFQDDANDIYGYDSAYDSNVAYSGGTAHYVDVDKASIGFEPTAEFTFTGTGFDLFSVTDNKTGAIRIDVTNASTGKVVARKLVNAYYGYNYENDKYVPVAPGDDNANYRALFQVPVLSLHDMDYGTYNVKVIPYYSTAFDINKVGSFGVYVDSVRIFDPMGEDNSVANEAYVADGEYAPQYRELRETLVTPMVDAEGKFTGEYDVTKLGDGKSLFLDGGKYTPADFGKIGPNNEIYLAKGQSISFDIETDSTAIPETIQIGMKLTGYNGSDYNKGANSGGSYAHTGTVTLENTNYSGWKETVTLNSATERYYNMEGVLEWKIQEDGTFKTVCPVIITNTSDAVISITSIKWAFGQSENSTTQLNLLSDEQTVTYAKAAIARAASGEEQSNPQNTFLAKENITASFSGEPYTVGDNGKLVVTTQQGVAGVTVNGTDIVNCEATEDGKLQWTYEFTADTAGSVVYEIVARDENGVSSETIYASTNIESDEQEETTTPEGDGEGDDESASDSDSGATLIPGDDLFAYNLVRMIFQFLNKILSMLTGGATV